MSTQETEALIGEAVKTAEAWQNRANQLLTPEERAVQKRMERLLTHSTDKVVLTKMIDQSFRSAHNSRVADQIHYILGRHSIPEFFSFLEKMLAKSFMLFGRYLPDFSVPKMIERIREDSGRAIIPGEKDIFHAHLQKRKSQGVRMNVNFLGEAVLGEAEALKRLSQYIEAMKSPEIEYVSVKISTIYSQISSLAFEHTVGVLVDRLSQLFRAARDNTYIRNDGTRVPKFVNLDMEEYRDLEITVAAFTRTLNLEEFKRYSAGIVLQAYLPDSHPIQRQLTEWAKKRVAEGGSPIKLRIVKGANMEMELVEASLHNWPPAPYDNKLDVDANYKRMVDFGMQPENIQAVNLGIASHNLFELAYAYKMGQYNNVTPYFTFEMLEGMADHVGRAIKQSAGELVLYAPVAEREQFINAIAYLIRRLDENTAEENFLRYASNLKTGAPQWEFLKKQFIASCLHKHKAGMKPHRTQNRVTETFTEPGGTFYTGQFINEPDTDWTLPPNREWAEAIRKIWKKKSGEAPIEIPVVVGGQEIFSGRKLRDCIDPSQGGQGVVVARFALANDEDADRAAATAKADPDGWRGKSQAERHEALSRVAVELRRARGDLIGAAAADTGKVFTEADVEVSEAVDFAEYYPFSVKTFTEMENVEARGRGGVLVISPWNFPIAIPCGGIAASLAAGNTVIFKPSSDAVLTAWRLCQCFWNAGISRNVLQFVPCSGATTGSRLTNHPAIDAIILTGGTDTGLKILQDRPDVYMSAETGGKNATIVTALSDRDQAIKNVVYSAFGNGGQKCSATSLLILEREVYEDAGFKEQLVDAARSFKVGSAWELENRMGPLIRPPAGDLERGLTQLEPGEAWALEPRNVGDNPHLWTPGIKWNVRPGFFTHRTELFGPVLAVMCAEDLDHAIDIANATGYGLTSGLESLDPREQEHWKRRIIAGNLYINRGTTGAITLRQPFGGMRKSALGAGLKAGGPDYVMQFMSFRETGFPRIDAIRKDHDLHRMALEWENKLRWGLIEPDEEIEKVVRAIKSYLYRHETDFSVGKDFFHLRGQDNILRYLPVGTVAIRLHPEDTVFDVLARVAAARISGCEVMVSIPRGLDTAPVKFLGSERCKTLLRGVEIRHQNDSELIGTMDSIQRIRYAAPDRVPQEVYQAAARVGFTIIRSPVLMEGRIELLHYFQQQSVCDTYHRYGNLGERTVI